MTKNSARIKAGLIALTHKSHELASGTMVPGSFDEDAFTISVLPTGATQAIDGVMLSSITNNGNGMIQFPKDGSSVVIGTVDGPGEWSLIKANELEKLNIVLGNSASATILTLTEDEAIIAQGDATITLKDGKFSIKNSTASLATILSNVLQHIQQMTVTTGTGPSGPPINISAFIKDSTDLNFLLE